MGDFVINYQMSTTPKAFVHRVGRVARNGKRGVAVSIVEHEELAYVADIYRFLGHKLPNDQDDDGDDGEESAKLMIFDEEEEEGEELDEEEEVSEDEEDKNVQIDN